jgi:hypothetical protein
MRCFFSCFIRAAFLKSVSLRPALLSSILWGSVFLSSVFLSSVLWSSRAFGLEAALGFGEFYSQVKVEDLANGTSSEYAGLGYLGELRFRLGGGGSGGGATGSSFNAKPDLFFFGAYFSQPNSTSVGSLRKSSVSGAGIDFRFTYLFLGGQVQTNASSIDTTTGTTTNSYSSFGVRAGVNVPFGANSPFLVQIGFVQNLGRGTSASLATGASISTETGVFLMIQGRLFQTSGGGGGK